VFVIVVALNATAALLALLIIRPMRRAFILDSEAAGTVPAASPRALEAGAEV
jgi:OFA family oxalate/formate antiporter-like MFS transporter